MDKLMADIEYRMKEAFEALLNSYSRTRSGRANTASLENIRINYYGQSTPIKQLCNLSIPEPRLIIVQPWDKTVLAEIEKSILASNIGVTPENDGNVIRLPFQPLTEETRREIVKQIKKMAEDAKIEVRNIRRQGNDEAKEKEKTGEISEDDLKKLLKSIQDLTDEWIEKISEIAAHKEKELMEV